MNIPMRGIASDMNGAEHMAFKFICVLCKFKILNRFQHLIEATVETDVCRGAEAHVFT